MIQLQRSSSKGSVRIIVYLADLTIVIAVSATLVVVMVVNATITIKAGILMCVFESSLYMRKRITTKIWITTVIKSKEERGGKPHKTSRREKKTRC